MMVSCNGSNYFMFTQIFYQLYLIWWAFIQSVVACHKLECNFVTLIRSHVPTSCET